jgi:hypothetical protein
VFIELRISLFLAGTTKLVTTARAKAVSSLDVDEAANIQVKRRKFAIVAS